MAINMFSVLKPSAIPSVVAFNTGCIYDLMTGDFQRGYDGKWYCRGGLGAWITGVMGRGNTFKSSIADSLIARVMAIYGGNDSLETQGMAYDTEQIKDICRFERCSDELGLKLTPDQFCIRSGAEVDLESMWDEIKAIGEFRLNNKKDFLVETPFVDPMTDKRLVSWLPAPLLIDALSSSISSNEEALLGNGIAAKETTRSYMLDGLKKSLMLRHLRPACERYGFATVICVTVGNNIAIDPMSHPSKPLPFMRQGDQPKGASSKILDLPRNLIQTLKCDPLQNKGPDGITSEYGSESAGAPSDLIEVSIGLQRSKNNCSGNVTPMVFSQTHGLRNSLSNYHYLRRQKYFGLVGSNANHRAALYPEVNLTRNTFRDKAQDDPKLRRAIELIVHYHYIKMNWSLPQEVLALFNDTPEELFEKMQKSGSAKTDEILASRSYWTIKDDGRPYMSILDVLELLQK